MTLDDLKTQLIHKWALYDHEIAQTIEALGEAPGDKRKIKQLENRRGKIGYCVSVTVSMLDELGKVNTAQLKPEGETTDANPLPCDRRNPDEQQADPGRAANPQ